MGPVNDDDDMATRTTAEAPVRSESPGRSGPPSPSTGDAEAGAERMAGAPGMEEAGYGYGV